jgi:hypothetical protein
MIFHAIFLLLGVVAHSCNPSYSGGGREQGDHGLNPAWANTLRDLISKIPIKKRALKWLKV